MQEVAVNHNLIFIKLLLALAASLLLSGCIKQELDDKLIIAGIGIDKTEDDKVKLTMGLIDTRPTEQQEAKGIHVYSTIGDTLFDATRNSIIRLGRQPVWPYIKVVVFGPSITKDNVTPYLDFINRNNEVQPNPYIVYSRDSAEKIIRLKTDFTTIPADVLEKQLEQQGVVSYIPAIMLHQFTEMMVAPDRAGYVAIIEGTKNDNKTVPKVQHTAVIKNGKWVGELNGKETRGLLWVKEEVKGGILVTPAINGGGKVGLEILDKTKASIKPLVKNGRIKEINVAVESTVSVGEILSDSKINKKSLENIKKLAKAEIKKEIQSAINQAKEFEVDILGFGTAVHRKYPKFWKKHNKEWNTLFTSIPVTIDVKVDIRNLGLFN